MKRQKLIALGIIAGLFALVSCNNSDDIPAEGKGRLNVHLTDAPFPIDMVSSTLVTIDKVEIRKHMEAGTEGEADSFIVLSENKMDINLLELTNGITEIIASVDLEPGNYDMIRLHVADASVKLNAGDVFNLSIPSGSTSGLKIKIDPAISISEGQTSDVLLDFDVNKSFVVKGNIGGKINGFIFKPVVRGIYMGVAGRIEGSVTDTTGTALQHAMVKVWNPVLNSNSTDDFSVSTFSDEYGGYKLIGLKEGKYTLVCETEGYESDTIQDVNVVAGKSVKVNLQLKQKINP